MGYRELGKTLRKDHSRIASSRSLSSQTLGEERDEDMVRICALENAWKTQRELSAIVREPLSHSHTHSFYPYSTYVRTDAIFMLRIFHGDSEKIHFSIQILGRSKLAIIN